MAVGVLNETSEEGSLSPSFALPQSLRRQTGAIIIGTIRNWNEDNVSRLAAVRTCYARLAIVSSSSISSLVSAVTALVMGASGVFSELQSALNQTWKAEHYFWRNARPE